VIFVGEELTAFVFVRSEYEKTLRTTGLNKTCYVILQVYSTLEEVNRLDSQKNTLLQLYYQTFKISGTSS